MCLGLLMLSWVPVFAWDKKESSAISNYIMGCVYEDSGDIEQAIQAYKKAVKADDSIAALHLGLASSYIKNNQPQKAIDELKISASLAPEAIEPHAILALLYTSLDKIDLATAEYETALQNASRLQPQNVDIYKGLGAIYLRQKKFKEAESAYKLILSLNPADAEAHYSLANVYTEMRETELAEKALKKAIGLRPDYHQALNFLAYMYIDAGKNLEQAELMLRKALDLEPDNPAYIDSLGWFYYKKGKFKESLGELKKAASMLEDPVIFDHLGDAYLKTGDNGNARSSWEKSIKLDPGQEKVKEKLQRLKVSGNEDKNGL